MNIVTLEQLLRVKDDSGAHPDFRLAVQETGERGVRVIIHAFGVNSETLDFWVQDNSLSPLDEELDAPRQSLTSPPKDAQ